MGTMIGAVAGIVLFAVFGLFPAFRFGSSLALYALYKVTGKSVDPTPLARIFILAGAIMSILCGAVFSIIAGALFGSIFLL